MAVLFIFLVVLLIAAASVQANFSLRRNDSEIATCEAFDVCNLVHTPYWQTNAVEKLCKCPEPTHCPATYDKLDEKSLQVNARTQMKFCSTIDELQSSLSVCEPTDIALTITTFLYTDQIRNISARLLCLCEAYPAYWEYHSHNGKAIEEDENLFEVTDNYLCSDLRKCEIDEFCGFARSDYGFVFQRCTCDNYSECRYLVEESELEENVDELFYNGLVYKSHCLLTNDSLTWDE